MKVSIIIPTYNSEKHIAGVIDAILSQDYPQDDLEIIVIDDNSTDNTSKIVNSYIKLSADINFIVKDKKMKRGAAASSNLGIKLSSGEIVCSIDSDAIISEGWLKHVVAEFSDPEVAAVAGYIKTANPERLVARFMGAELEDRYHQIKSKEVDHVSTCNTAYRKKIIEAVGGFDEELYYGYDVDLSYKVKKAGYRILLMKNVGCRHIWKSTLIDYLIQQFHSGYGRIYLVGKYPKKMTGDKVSGLKMMSQVPLLFLALIFLFFYPAISAAIMCLIIFLILPQTIRILYRKKDPTFILFPFFLIGRNAAWFFSSLKYVFDKAFLRKGNK